MNLLVALTASLVLLSFASESLALARDAPEIVARQLTRDDLISRASRTRPKRQTVSPPVCNPNSFILGLVGTAVGGTPERFVTASGDKINIGPIDQAVPFVLDVNKHLKSTTSPLRELWASPPASILYSRDVAEVGELTCDFTLFGIQLVCTAIAVPTQGIFQACSSRRGALLFGSQLFDNTCVQQTVLVIRACT